MNSTNILSDRTCGRCGGTGQIQTVRQSMFGQMVSIEDCPECRGKGRTSAEKCPHCRGAGRINKDSHIDLNIPKGMEEGMRLRVAGAGNAGYNGGPAGDLFVVIHIKEDSAKAKVQRDIRETAVELPANLGMEAELGIITRAAREIYRQYYPNEGNI